MALVNTRPWQCLENDGCYQIYYGLHRLNCIGFSLLMHLPQIHSNKSFLGLYLQSAEHAICIRQGNALCSAGVELGRRDSSFCLSKVSGKQSQVVQRARDSHRHLAFPPHVGSCQF